MINRSDEKLSISNQCKLLKIHRNGLYYKAIQESEEDLRVLRLLDQQYPHTPFYGIRRLAKWLEKVERLIIFLSSDYVRGQHGK